MKTRWPIPRVLAPLAAAVLLAAAAGMPAPGARASEDEEPETSLIAMEPYLRQGYSLREEHWDGTLAVGETRTVRYQLFKEHAYVFCAVAEVRGARLSIRVTDPEDSPVAVETQQVEHAGKLSTLAPVRPPRTGAYTFVVRLEQSPVARAGYGLVYCYK